MKIVRSLTILGRHCLDIRGFQDRVSASNMDEELAKVEAQIGLLEPQIQAAGESFLSALQSGNQSLAEYWRKEEEQLREKKLLLLRSNVPHGIGGSVVPDGVAALVRATDTPDSKFWILDSDALRNYDQPFLLWKRKAYASLESKIRELLGNFTSFIVLGTAGIGKSFFGYHWIIRLGQMGQEKALYKVGEVVYILNLRSRYVEGGYDVNGEIIRQMLDDPSMWLVIDEKQETPLPGKCRVLLVCSSKNANYDEFGKGGLCCMLYMSVWSREEIGKFLDDFEPYRTSYGNMNVVDRKEGLDNFDYLGGVPRYVLRATKLKEGKSLAKSAVESFGSSVSKAAKILSGGYVKNVSDCILHIVATEDHSEKTYQFASEALMTELGNQYLRAGAVPVVGFLKETFTCPWVGALWGKLYEPLVHRLLLKGGDFVIKAVYANGSSGPETSVHIGPHIMLEASSAGEFGGKIGMGKYVQPTSEVFPSIDSGMDEDILIQVFKRVDGKHGFEASGLEMVDAALKRPSYRLWSCVPKETFPRTGWQQYKNNNDGDYGRGNAVFGKMRQFVVQVDYEDAR
ncbi:uncharacterized protein LOC112342420 [Selaginella moellendorffii]|uniref:uncharacterized protein LOC112342420 n=1 Tax=Selaginella moellendorffii TaxID=88036 RepID=UPI000D1C43E5|nr:uncharacterized protein LOC112342420 [Selaginella moellendorffii]|eukprot:XP_024519976.1 uncharacterized protein LOC112342420 [Selaginella moellendorffii]